MVIEDRIVFPLATADSTRQCGFGWNFNGSPTKNTNEGCLGSFDGVAVSYYSFPKFDYLKNLYETVRCRWVKFNFIPRCPNDVATVGNYSPFYIIKERDGTDFGIQSSADTVDIEQIATEPSMKTKNWFRPWKVFQRSIKYGVLSKIPSTIQGVTAGTGTNLMGQWHGIGSNIGLLDEPNGLHIYGQTGQGINTGTLGTIIVTASFTLRGNYRPAIP